MTINVNTAEHLAWLLDIDELQGDTPDPTSGLTDQHTKDTMKNSTDINIVLDRSGSMISVRNDTIGGFNAFIDEQKALPGTATLSLLQFDDQFDTVYAGVPLAEVKPLNNSTFVPRGGTALLDAIGRTINETGARLAAMSDDDRPGKVLLVIMTDGGENSSREFDRAKINDMISHQRDKYSWQIAFIGANQDAIAVGSSIGIPVSNSLNYASTGVGTRAAMKGLSSSVGAYRGSTSVDTTGFFNDPSKVTPT